MKSEYPFDKWQRERCDVCGAPMLHTNNEMCKNYHLQKEPMTNSSEQPKEQLPEYIINYNDVLVIRGFMIRAGYPEEQINAFEGQITAKLGEGHDTHPHPAPQEDGCKFRVAKMEAMYDNGYADGSRKAREDVFKQLEEYAYLNYLVKAGFVCPSALPMQEGDITNKCGGSNELMTEEEWEAKQGGSSG